MVGKATKRVAALRLPRPTAMSVTQVQIAGVAIARPNSANPLFRHNANAALRRVAPRAVDGGGLSGGNSVIGGRMLRTRTGTDAASLAKPQSSRPAPRMETW